MDASGNVYIADSGNSCALKLDYVTPPSLSFASAEYDVQSNDSPQQVTVLNAGNAALTFLPPTTGGNPAISTSFTFDGATTCPQLDASSSTTGTLAANTSCVYAVDFIPQAVGPISGSLVLTDDNLNVSGAQQTINLSGQATQAAQTITFNNPGPLTFGASPTLTATASSGLMVTLTSATTGVCAITSGGVLTTVGPGTCTIIANQPGNAEYLAAPQVSQGFAVISATLTVSANNATRVYGTANPVFTGGVTGALNGDTFTESFTTTATITVGAPVLTPLCPA